MFTLSNLFRGIQMNWFLLNQSDLVTPPLANSKANSDFCNYSDNSSLCSAFFNNLAQCEQVLAMGVSNHKSDCKTQTFDSKFWPTFDQILVGFWLVWCLVRLVCDICGASWVILYDMEATYVMMRTRWHMECGEHNPCHRLCEVYVCWGVRFWVRITAWLVLWLHLILCIGLFRLVISCIRNLKCVYTLSSVVLWLGFDLITRSFLGFCPEF